MVGAGIDPGYLLDRMEWYELEACLDGIEKARRAGWEQTRSIVLAVANAAGAKVTTKDFALPWDDERTTPEPDRDEVAALREMVNKLNSHAADMGAVRQ